MHLRITAIGMLLVAIAVDAMATEKSPLYRTLTGRNEAVRMRALTEFELNSARKVESLPELADAVRHLSETAEPDEILRPSVVRLIYSIASVDHSVSSDVLIELLDSTHTGIAMLSADALGMNKFYDATEDLKRQVERPEYASSYAFRFNLVRALARMEHPDAVEFLSTLRDTLDGQLRFQIEKLLSEVTEDHFLGDQQRYAVWLKTKAKQEETVFKAVGFDADSGNPMLGESQKYYGIDIRAKRVMFIIDHSGSMQQYWAGTTRLERAKFELIRAIEELPSDYEFSIVFYHSRVRRWRDELVEANDKNKRKAIQFVRRLGYGSKTNTYGALRTALDFDDDLEAVFLLTDGEPTHGEIIHPNAIVADILHRNRFRHLNFNTIGVGVGSVTEDFLRTLAEESSGEYRRAQ